MSIRMLFIASSAILLAACAPDRVQFSLPQGAVPIRTPRDIDGAWLDNQVLKIRLHLSPRFGGVSVAEYRVDGDYTWDTILAHFDAELREEQLVRAHFPEMIGRRYRMAAWTRSRAARAPFLVVAEIEFPPSSNQQRDSRIIVVITPRS